MVNALTCFALALLQNVTAQTVQLGLHELDRRSFFEAGSTMLPLEDELVKFITRSPFAELRADLLGGLRVRFGSCVRQSCWAGVV